FVSNTRVFNDILSATHSVVSGSIALRLLFPPTTIDWPTTDMDIYVPKHTSHIVIDYFHKEGYTSVSHGCTTSTYARTSILKVYTLLKGYRTIDIVVSKTGCALKPIFQFHTTGVMNFVTADTILCAYPTLTTKFRSLINPIALRDARLSIPMLQAIVKYSDRGFSIHGSPSA
ncbi:hypothetical protein BV22DRAFT_982838, partial [Leucogyrophana mollusca]